MADSLRFHPLVAEDLQAATKWYDDISVDLGNRFRRAVNSRFDAVESRPDLYGRVQNEIRATRVEGFPYLVVFEIFGDVAEVLGVVHSAADPAKWNRRPR